MPHAQVTSIVYGTSVEGELSFFNSTREWSDSELADLNAELGSEKILTGKANHSSLLSQRDSKLNIRVHAKGFIPSAKSFENAVATFGNDKDDFSDRSGKTQLAELAAVVKESQTVAKEGNQKSGLFPLYATFTPLYENYVGSGEKLKVPKMLAKEASLAHTANLLLGRLNETLAVLDEADWKRPQIVKDDTEAEDLEQAATDCRKHVEAKIDSTLYIFEKVVEDKPGKKEGGSSTVQFVRALVRCFIGSLTSMNLAGINGISGP